MHQINEISMKLEGYNYTMSLDLNMVCYNILLIEDKSNLYMIILQWIKYHYKRLPIGVSNSPDIFQ